MVIVTELKQWLGSSLRSREKLLALVYLLPERMDHHLAKLLLNNALPIWEGFSVISDHSLIHFEWED